MSQKSNHTSTMANDDNCYDVSDYNSFFPNVLDFLEDEIQAPSHKSTGMRKWTNQYCWNGKICRWDRCQCMHPGPDKCISPSCLDMGCMKIHDTTKTGWSCKRDESSREKIAHKIQSSHNVPIKEQCSRDQHTEILNTAFCVPKGINSVKIIINGIEIVLGPESIAPVMDVLCKQGYWPDA